MATTKWATKTTPDVSATVAEAVRITAGHPEYGPARIYAAYRKTASGQRGAFINYFLRFEAEWLSEADAVVLEPIARVEGGVVFARLIDDVK